MIGRLDRYVGRAVLSSYLAALAFMIFLVVLFDLLLGLGKYLQVAEQRNVDLTHFLGFLASYYVFMTPMVFVVVAPFVTVIACMFAISRLMTNNEVAPMVFIGRSTMRVLAPTLGMALISGLAMSACWEFVIPAVIDRVQANRAELENQQVSHKLLLVTSPQYPDRQLFCAEYLHGTEQLRGVVRFDRGSAAGDATMITADEAWWTPEHEQGDWHLRGGAFKSGQDTVPVQWLGMPEVTPALLWQAAKNAKQTGELSYSDLLELREARPNRHDYVLQFHRHLTGPLANLVLLLLALPLAIHFERGSRLGRVVLAIGICAAYLVVDLICQNLGLREILHPIVAAWVPTILFGALGLVMFSGVRS